MFRSRKTYPWIAVVAVLGFFMLLSACKSSQHPTVSRQAIDRSGTTSSDANGAVIEVVTFKLKPGVTVDEFRLLDRAVELQHVSKQPGFISRESAAGEDGQWIVVVRWRSIEDAEASMASFASAAPTAEFMSKLDEKSMSMKRYMAN